jgi:hypothetical protein
LLLLVERRNERNGEVEESYLSEVGNVPHVEVEELSGGSEEVGRDGVGEGANEGEDADDLVGIGRDEHGTAELLDRAQRREGTDDCCANQNNV